jgi:alcohol dehydrogenase class IV
MIPGSPDQTPVTEFRGPGEVVVGDGSVERVGQVAGRLIRPGRVLLVTDAHLVAAGLVTPVADALEVAGYTVEIFGEAAGEPDARIAERVANPAREPGIEGVIGLGGGSALDLTKIAAAAVTNDGPPERFVGIDALSHGPKPMVLIPTTAGTGSEATHIAMVTVDGKKRIINDSRLIPDAAILDPFLTLSLPASVTAATGLDALTHAIESLLSRNANPLTAAMSAEAVRLLSRWLLPAYRDGEDKEARRATLYGAHIAGRALNAGTILGHATAYTIANRAHLPHGVTCAMALPYCLGYCLANPFAGRKLDALAADVADASVATGLDLLKWIGGLNDALEVPDGLRAAGIDRRELQWMASECMELYPRPNNPVPLEPERLATMFAHLWEGDVAGYVEDVLDRTEGPQT